MLRSAHITLLLDRSGSMRDVADDTIGGYNTFLSAQRVVPGAATVTLIQFDDHYEPVYSMRPILQAPNLSAALFQPRGQTALVNAAVRGIDDTGADLMRLAPHDRPGDVFFVILTDGQENASHREPNPLKRFTYADLAGRIAHQQERYHWHFLFLGANQDAIAEASKFAIRPEHALTYAPTAQGINHAYRAAAANVVNVRAGVTRDVGFSAEDRRRATSDTP